MRVDEMIDALSKLPQDAEIFEGSRYSKKIDGLPLFELYDREPIYNERVWSCGSSAPWKRSIQNHVVILEAP